MKTVRLGSHAKLVRGITFKPADKCGLGELDAVVCMRTKNVQRELDDSDLIAVPRSLVKSPEKMISPGDILVSSANSWNLVGKCCQVRELRYPSAAGGFISILRSTSDQLDASYLYRWFSSKRTQTILRSFGNRTTNISNLNHKRTLNLSLPLPPLAEQKRIAKILDAADALRAKRRESLALLDELLRSTFLDMFGDPVLNPKGWPEVSLGDLITNGPQNGIYKASKNYGSGTRILRIDGFYDGAVSDLGTLKRVRLSQAEVEKYRLSEQDLVINRVNSRKYLGKSAIVPPLDEPVVFESNMMRMALDQKRIAPRYAVEFMQTRCIKRQIDQAAKDAVNQSSINQGDVKGLRLLLPPVSLQTRFVSVADAIARQRLLGLSQLAELDNLFASLQSRAFRGEL